MRLLVVGTSIFSLAALAAIYVAPAPSSIHQDRAAVSSGSTCDSKHCSPNTHCCYSCSGSPICVKNGVPCPECAPQ